MWALTAINSAMGLETLSVVAGKPVGSVCSMGRSGLSSYFVGMSNCDSEREASCVDAEVSLQTTDKSWVMILFSSSCSENAVVFFAKKKQRTRTKNGTAGECLRNLRRILMAYRRKNEFLGP